MGLLCTSFTVIPSSQPYAGGELPAMEVREMQSASLSYDNVSLYNDLCLEQYGLSVKAFEYAYSGYKKLCDQKKVTRSRYLSICDFSQSSKNKRLYIIDIEQNKLLINTWVAHGKNSGGEYAAKFSNVHESLQSSLGFYVTGQTYIGDHGLSLRMHGVDQGYNTNAYDRSIVIHGAEYVDAARAKKGIMMGRSYGCPAVPQKESANIINIVKNGTCLFVYHPNQDYLLHSKILND